MGLHPEGVPFGAIRRADALVREEQRLTREQEALRRRGLRILARMIASAYMASLNEKNREKNTSVHVSDGGISGEDDGRAG